MVNPNNSSYKQCNQQLILIALMDGQWHRIMELKKETKLSPRTLYKHLNELEKVHHWIERKEDTESGEYPHPVLYRANDVTVSYTSYMKSVFDIADKMETRLRETNDPFETLDDVHKNNQYYFAIILEAIQKQPHMTQKQLDYMASLLIYSPYQIYTNNLIAAFAKAVQFGTRFDINQLKQYHNVPQLVLRTIHSTKPKISKEA